MLKNSLVIALILVALLSGCVSKGVDISGTYTHPYKEFAFSKEEVQEFIFYPDGTFYYWDPVGTNSGVYKIQGKDLIVTGQLVTKKFTILNDNTLLDSKNSTWNKKS